MCGEKAVASSELARFIDHTLLKPDATLAMIERLCSEAVQHRFYSVCVNACYVEAAAAMLRGSPVKVCCVAGFPLGAAAPEDKASEAKRAIASGAAEIDMVLNTGFFLSGLFEKALNDIKAVSDVVHVSGRVLKVIIETGILVSDENIVRACRLCEEGEADFVKTCTGFAPGQATVEHVRLIRAAIPAGMQVKASGGIRDARQAMALIEAGAARLGTSAGVQILNGLQGNDVY